jgi:hypothetical protein
MGEDSDESDEDSERGPIFKIVNPTITEERAAYSGISNLAALRLLNDVNFRPSPSIPTGTRRISPPNRLIDYAGWQEIYGGKSIWIYDAKSNVDQSVRVVSQQGDFYGTAT